MDELVLCLVIALYGIVTFVSWGLHKVETKLNEFQERYEMYCEIHKNIHKVVENSTSVMLNNSKEFKNRIEFLEKERRALWSEVCNLRRGNKKLKQ